MKYEHKIARRTRPSILNKVFRFYLNHQRGSSLVAALDAPSCFTFSIWRKALILPGTEKGYIWPHLRRPALAIDFYRVSWILYYWTPQKVSYHLIDPFLQDSLLTIVISIPITFLTSLFLSFNHETLPWRPTSLFSLEQNPAWCLAPLLPCPTSLKSAAWSSFSLLQITLSGSQHSVLFSLRIIF